MSAGPVPRTIGCVPPTALRAARPEVAAPHLGADRLRARLASRGGFTVHPVTGEEPSAGYAVCPDRRWSHRIAWTGWDDRQVEGMVAAFEPELRRVGRFLGGWLEPGARHAWIEVVVVVEPERRHTALSLAAAARQAAVFDLGGALVVTTEGGR